MASEHSPPHAGQIEVDDTTSQADNRDNETTDSAVAADDSSETQSVASSVYKHLDQYGRTYHKDGKWHVPDDENEQERMDILHHAMRVLFDNRLIYYEDQIQPSIKRILDVGTGTGIWAIEIADAYPEASVVGMDQSPIQPAWVPPNCEFIIHNAEETWDFHTPFDLVHIRSMEGAFRDWPQVYRQAYDSMAPGGSVHVVSQDLWTYRDDGPVPESINSWMTEFNQLMETLQHPTRIARKHSAWAKDAGFEDIQEKEVLVPLGWWAKDPTLKRAGTFYLASVLEAIESYSLKPFVDHAGWTVEEVAVLRATVDKAYRNMDFHLYSKVVVVVGSKPGQAAA